MPPDIRDSCMKVLPNWRQSFCLFRNFVFGPEAIILTMIHTVKFCIGSDDAGTKDKNTNVKECTWNLMSLYSLCRCGSKSRKVAVVYVRSYWAGWSMQRSGRKNTRNVPKQVR